nr:probable ATP-dependent DNA helicase HFM1 isoform X2 [Dermacentor andersoni]
MRRLTSPSSLLQAMLGCMAVVDSSLAQDIPRIVVVALRLARALVSLLVLRSPACGFSALLHAVTLQKCLQARLWEDSPHVARQLEHIGPALSSSLVRAGLTSLDKLANANPRELELVVNRRPPFGSRVVLAARRIPKYELDVKQESCRGDHVTLSLLVQLRPLVEGRTGESPSLDLAAAHLVIGDADDRLLFYQRILPHHMAVGWARRIALRRAGSGDSLAICLVSSKHVGVDVRRNFTPRYASDNITLRSPWIRKVEDAARRGMRASCCLRATLRGHRQLETKAAHAAVETSIGGSARHAARLASRRATRRTSCSATTPSPAAGRAATRGTQRSLRKQKREQKTLL